MKAIMATYKLRLYRLLSLKFVTVHLNPRPYHLLKRSYQSDIHTNKLYPGSNILDRLKTYATISSSSGHPSGFSGEIPVKDLKITYALSSGPGGQNANKIATKVDLRFHLNSATWLKDDVKEKLREKWKWQLTKDGYYIVKSERTRSQMLNQADAIEKLRQAIWTALEYNPNKRIKTAEVSIFIAFALFYHFKQWRKI